MCDMCTESFTIDDVDIRPGLDAQAMFVLGLTVGEIRMGTPERSCRKLITTMLGEITHLASEQNRDHGGTAIPVHVADLWIAWLISNFIHKPDDDDEPVAAAVSAVTLDGEVHEGDIGDAPPHVAFGARLFACHLNDDHETFKALIAARTAELESIGKMLIEVLYSAATSIVGAMVVNES